MKKTFFLLSILCLIFVFWYHNVPKNLTVEDKKVLAKMLHNIKEDKLSSICDEISLIRAIQAAVLNGMGRQRIPEFQTREPADYLRNKGGLCYDKSRTLEKAISYKGFSTRHVSVFYETNTSTKDKYLFLNRNVNSHAVVEVKTSAGWLVLDTSSKWIGTNDNCEVFSTHELSTLKDSILISTAPKGLIASSNLQNVIIYGLYSRHGKFYPPYNFIPDYNISEFVYNIVE